MSIVISVENLSKVYRLGLIGGRTLKADFERWWARARGRPDPLLKIGQEDRSNDGGEYIWALKDVSFTVEQGEVVGIIGPNGAGKSTLLKIMSRVTAPTSGQVKVRGRIASLLEVGTGFHPELTGRENIYLNGAILGMTRREIQGKFDEIVNFAELEKFIDTPVKRYSSGMYVRLAFAVAAHLEPEILIVDEVLAVGDAEFQKKCIGKMGDVSREGRTVLLVSHNMTTIQALAGKAIYLDSGFTQGVITVSDAVRQYIYGNEQSVLSCFRAVNPSSSRKNAYIVEARVINKKGDTVQEVETCEPLLIEIKWINRSGVPVNPNFVLVNHSGVAVMSAIDTPIDWTGSKKSEPGAYTSRAKIPPHLLSADDYFVHLALDSSTPRVCHDVHPNALRFTLIDPIDERCIARGDYKTPFNTVLLPALEWTWEYERDNKELSGLIK